MPDMKFEFERLGVEIAAGVLLALSIMMLLLFSAQNVSFVYSMF